MANWGLAIPPLHRILRDLTFNTKADAVARAKEENACGEFKGRGVRVVRIDRGDYAG